MWIYSHQHYYYNNEWSVLEYVPPLVHIESLPFVSLLAGGFINSAYSVFKALPDLQVYHHINL